MKGRNPTAKEQDHAAQVSSWMVASVPGIECFRARAMDHHYGLHTHEAYSIGVIEDGVGGNDYRGSVLYIPAGSIIVMNPDEAHTGFAAGGTALTYRMFYLSEEAFRWLTPEYAGAPYFADPCILNVDLANRLRELHRFLETSTETLAKHIHLIESFSLLAKRYGSIKNTSSPANEPKAIRQIKEYISTLYHQNIALEDLVSLTNLDRAYLIRSFRRRTGLPPHTYLLQVRIEHAKRLLSQGIPISQVAQEVGFSDQSHLTRRFKSLTGLTPKQFIQGHFRSRLNSSLTR